MQIVIVSHGRLASGMVSACGVLLRRNDLNYIDAYVDDHDYQNDIDHLFEQFSSDEIIIVFSDIASGSVNQYIMRFLKTHDMHIIAGVNISVVLEFLLNENEDITKRIQESIERGKEEIVYINEVIKYE